MDLTRRGFLGAVGAAIATVSIQGEYIGAAPVEEAPRLLRKIGRGCPALWINNHGFALLDDWRVRTDQNHWLMETRNPPGEEWVDRLIRTVTSSKCQWLECGFVFEEGMVPNISDFRYANLQLTLLKPGGTKLVGEGYLASYAFEYPDQDIATGKFEIQISGCLEEVVG